MLYLLHIHAKTHKVSSSFFVSFKIHDILGSQEGFVTYHIASSKVQRRIDRWAVRWWTWRRWRSGRIIENKVGPTAGATSTRRRTAWCDRHGTHTVIEIKMLSCAKSCGGREGRGASLGQGGSIKQTGTIGRGTGAFTACSKAEWWWWVSLP